MLLIDMLAKLNASDDDKDLAVKAKREEFDGAWNGFFSTLPHICALIRSSYDTTIKRPDGKDALALLVSLLIPLGVERWSYRLADALLARGADINTRFDGGQTPLIQWALGNKPPNSMHPACAIGPLLLLQRGADIDARTDIGTTCAHAIAIMGNHHLASALADAGWLAAADLTLLNNKGETALQVARGMLSISPDEGKRQMICDLLRDHAALWTAKARPLIHRWLSHSLLIPDLAHVVLSFVDGRERGQTE
jgi:hypothetical protein